MKANPWILPGVAVLLTGAWIGLQRNTASELRREITVINERIHQARSIADAEARDGGGKKDKAKTDKIDWKDLAGKMKDMRDGDGQDIRTMMRMQRLLMDLTAEELCTQLDEIAALDIEENVRKQLQGMIMGSLAEKDPKLALERFGKDLQDDEFGVSWQMSHALGKWADKEPAAAAAWLDKRIAEGGMESKSLDGRNSSLVRFESSLVGALLKTDPAAATARVKALNEAQREQFFQQGFFFQLGKESEGTYAKLARETMPADKISGILADTARNLVRQGGFERVDGFIASSAATDGEKQTIVERVLKNKITDSGDGKINTEEMDKARAWGKSQSPAVVDKATGEALANSLWQGADYNKASEIVLKYNDAGSNDEVLVTFLKNAGRRHSSTPEEKENFEAQSKTLIDRIKDPVQREEIRAQFAK